MSSSRCVRPLAALVVTAGLLGACSSDGGSASTTDAAVALAPDTPSTLTATTDLPAAEAPTTEPAVTAPQPTDAPETTEPTAEEAWPAEAWPVADPADAGLDPGALEAMADRAEAAGSDCLVVTHDGRIVGEWYWNGTDERSEREAYSVTKSITSALVGIAIDRGLLSLDQPASDFIEEWVGTPSEGITIRNLVSNDSGRFQDFETDYIAMAGQAEDKTSFSIALEQQYDPGKVWVYNNAAIQTLEAVLRSATGMPVGEFADEVLFEPLGMDTSIITDATGNTLTFMGAQASCRDLARFGLLFLRGGEWNGEQVVSREWVEAATTPSTELNSAYGFLWWLNRPGPMPLPDGTGTREGQLIPGVPEDMFAALGLFDQIVAVVPSSELVVTRLGEASGEDGSVFDLGTLISSVVAALIE